MAFPLDDTNTIIRGFVEELRFAATQAQNGLLLALPGYTNQLCLLEQLGIGRFRLA